MVINTLYQPLLKGTEVERDSRRQSTRGNRLKVSKWFKVRNYLAMALGLAIVALLAIFGPAAVYESGSGLIHQNVARFLNSVTSREGVGDHHNGPKVYAIMMDAGSTGSRILVFTFSKSPTDGSLKLEDEFYREVKPGISSYHEDPALAANSIRELFDNAKAIVPKDQWSSTPASLKATAGLRLLPGHKAENLLEAIREVFLTSGFRAKPESVEIINGTSEGLYCWTTINFLLDKLHDNLNETVAVIDMGGGSMQLALVPMEPSTIMNAPPDDIITIRLVGKPVQFYIRSFLGLGLMAVRQALLQRSDPSYQPGSLKFVSPFFQEGAIVNWEFQGKKFTITGASRQQLASSEEKLDTSEEIVDPSSFIPCKNLVFQIISENGVHRIRELQRRHLFAISYFFDRAVEALLIDQSTGGFTRVEDLCKSAREACEVHDPSQPFACIDRTYLCTLLEDGFGLTNDQVLNMKKKIDGHETSWALGAALSDLDKQSKKRF